VNDPLSTNYYVSSDLAISAVFYLLSTDSGMRQRSDDSRSLPEELNIFLMSRRRIDKFVVGSASSSKYETFAISASSRSCWCRI